MNRKLPFFAPLLAAVLGSATWTLARVTDLTTDDVVVQVDPDLPGRAGGHDTIVAIAHPQAPSRT